MVTALVALGSLMAGSGPWQPGDNPLRDYLRLPQAGLPPVKIVKRGNILEIEFSSQRWQNMIWTHRVLLLVPKGAENSKTAILYITGDGPKAGDFVDLNLLAAATGMPIAMLFNIPNQPLWEMKEDDLIAHTFEKFIQTGDRTWPLLFPMTKAAVRSLDVVQRVSQNNGLKVKQFVVTGASKRGWTSWLVGAADDKRVKGIAPMVFDNLNFDAQMRRQMEYWGKFSPQIEDYTRRGLQAKLETPAGKQLMQMVDPFFYRKLIDVPTLIVNGANDAYWTVDSHQAYWNDLRQPKYLLQVPNSGHGLQDRNRVIAGVSAFAKSIDGRFRMPKLSAKLSPSKDSSRFAFQVSSSEPPKDQLIWLATSPNRDYSEVLWTSRAFSGKSSDVIDAAPDTWTAAYVEAKYEIEGVKFSLTTPVELIKPRG